MDRPPVALACCLLVAAVAAPVAAHGGRTTERQQAGPYNVTFFTSATVVGGETDNTVFWTVQYRDNGTYHDGNATAEITYYDAGNATLSTTTEPTESAEFPRNRTALFVRPAYPRQARWVDYTLHLPNASVTFDQAVQAPDDGSDDDTNKTGPRTPLGTAVPVAAVAVAWILARRRSRP